MEVREFIDNYREAFGDAAGLPVTFWYSDEPVAATPKVGGCFFREIRNVRAGRPASLTADNIGCGGGRFYTGFAPLSPHTPDFVSVKEKYKETPAMVLDFIERSEVPGAAGKYLNLVRLDTLGGNGHHGGSFDVVEGLVFFATPDILSGLTTWTFFDNNADDAVMARFGSGCSTIITDTVRENRRHGRRTFIGCFDPSVRPWLEADVLSFAIPMSRFREMCGTMHRSSLFGTHAWEKVRRRIDGL